MSNRIELPLTPSWPLALLWLCPWTALAALSLGLPGPLSLRALGASTLLAIGFFLHSATALQWRSTSPVRLTVVRDQCWLEERSGDAYPIQIAPASRLTHGLAWLKITGAGKSQPLVLSSRFLIRNTDRDSLRRLLVWLRLSGDHAAPDSPSTTSRG